MTDVVDRLAAAMIGHDLDAVAGLIHPDYRSEQPAHPGRAFTGRAQMLANWEAMLAGFPDFRAEICRSVQDGDTTWTEWRWSGTRSDGQAFEMRGVTLFEVAGGQVVAGRLYLEDVEQEAVGIEQAVEDLSGRRRGRGPVGRRSALAASRRSSGLCAWVHRAAPAVMSHVRAARHPAQSQMHSTANMPETLRPPHGSPRASP